MAQTEMNATETVSETLLKDQLFVWLCVLEEALWVLIRSQGYVLDNSPVDGGVGTHVRVPLLFQEGGELHQPELGGANGASLPGWDSGRRGSGGLVPCSLKTPIRTPPTPLVKQTF